jgi:hypothetical protein
VFALQFPLGVILLSVGLSLLTYGFGAFFQFLPGQDLSAVMLIYGFPISLIGAALQYAKLDPVPMTTYKAALALREEGATKIQIQVYLLYLCPLLALVVSPLCHVGGVLLGPSLYRKEIAILLSFIQVNG